MSTQSSPPRAYGFPPLFRGASSSQQLRVSDAERQAVVDRLSGHYADGRLDHAEFDERVGLAMTAKTQADLNGLFADLPETGAPAGPDLPQRGPDLPRRGPDLPRRGPRHPVLGVVLLVVVIVAAAHAVFAGPWLFLGFVAVALLFATRRVRHYRPSQDH